jgi:hypothetical protein
MKENTLAFALLAKAEELALETYGCGLDRMDPDHLEWFASQVTEKNIIGLAGSLAAAAWFDN